MAGVITQTDADRAGISPVRVKITCATSSNEIYGIKKGSIYEITGDGDPNGELTAPISSIFHRKTAATGKLYVNTDGASAWTAQA